MDMEELEDAQILATLLRHLPSCINAADMAREQLLQDILVHPPVAIPARTMQEATVAKDLPPLDVDAQAFTLGCHSRPTDTCRVR